MAIVLENESQVAPGGSYTPDAAADLLLYFIGSGHPAGRTVNTLDHGEDSMTLEMNATLASFAGGSDPGLHLGYRVNPDIEAENLTTVWFGGDPNQVNGIAMSLSGVDTAAPISDSAFPATDYASATGASGAFDVAAGEQAYMFNVHAQNGGTFTYGAITGWTLEREIILLQNANGQRSMTLWSRDSTAAATAETVALNITESGSPSGRGGLIGVLVVGVDGAGGGNTGTATPTEADDTSSASGGIGFTSSLAETNEDDSASASGAVTNSGTLAETEANDTSSAAGTQTNVGTSTATEDGDASAASGGIGFVASLAETEEDDAASGAGNSLHSGTVAQTETDDTSTATASLGYTGTASVTEEDEGAAATGLVEHRATSAETEADDTSTIVGIQTNTGSAAATEGDDTPTIVSVVGGAPSGTVAATEGEDTATAAGTLQAIGTTATTEEDDTSSAVAGFAPVGTVAETEDDDTSVANGAIAASQTGTVAATEGDDYVPYSIPWRNTTFNYPPIGADGYAVFTPQATTNIYYVSTSGNDGTGEPYLPSDIEVGADPFDPDGPINAYADPETAANLMSAGDWLLLKRGDVWTAWGGEIVPTSGVDADERTLYGTYGSGARPRLEWTRTAGVMVVDSGETNKKNIWISGWEFYPRQRDPDDGSFNGGDNAGNVIQIAASPTVQSENIYIEDVFSRFGGIYFNGSTSGFLNVAHKGIILRRCIVQRNYKVGTSSQGFWAYHAQYFLDECVLDHNGWIIQNDGLDDRDPSNGMATLLSHNHYTTGAQDSIIKRCIITRASSIGTKFTANQSPNGATSNTVAVKQIAIDENVFAHGEIGTELGGNDSFQDGPRWQDILIRGNAFVQIGETRPTARSLAWGTEMMDWERGEILDNLYAHYGNGVDVTNVTAIYASGSFGEVSIKDTKIRRNTVTGLNIGVTFPSLLATSNAAIGAHTSDNEVSDNRFAFLSGSAGVLFRTSAEFGAGTRWFNNATNAAGESNVYNLDGTGYATQNAYDTALGQDSGAERTFNFVDSTRDLDDYAVLLLGASNGVDELCDTLGNQRKGNWDTDYTAPVILAYLNDGYVEAYSASSANLEEDDSSTAAGTVAVGSSRTGTVAVTEEDDTPSVVGALGASGTAAVTESDDTGVATSVVGAAGGAVVATEADDSSLASSTVTAIGTATATEGEDTSSVTAVLAHIASVSPTEDDDTALTSGLVGNVLGGLLNVSEGDDAPTASAEIFYLATAAPTEGDDSGAATGSNVAGATLSESEEDDLVNASANVTHISTAIVTEEDDNPTVSGGPILDVDGSLAIAEQPDYATAVAFAVQPVSILNVSADVDIGESVVSLDIVNDVVVLDFGV